MRGWVIAAALVLVGCKSSPKALGETREVRNEGGSRLRVTGLVAGASAGLLLVENVGRESVYDSLGCNMDLEPGERRVCSGAPSSEGLRPGNTSRIALTLKEPSIERIDDTHARFRAFVRNDTKDGATVIKARFNIVDAEKHFVGGGNPYAVWAGLGPGEEALVQGDVPLVPGASGALTLDDARAVGSKAPPRVPTAARATLTNGRIINIGTAPIRAKVTLLAKDKDNRIIAVVSCEVQEERGIVPVVAPGESFGCTASKELPASHRIDVEASPPD